jgi:hypothetical protein
LRIFSFETIKASTVKDAHERRKLMMDLMGAIQHILTCKLTIDDKRSRVVKDTMELVVRDLRYGFIPVLFSRTVMVDNIREMWSLLKSLSLSADGKITTSQNATETDSAGKAEMEKLEKFIQTATPSVSPQNSDSE